MPICHLAGPAGRTAHAVEFSMANNSKSEVNTEPRIWNIKH
jgi:hypothetical protein